MAVHSTRKPELRSGLRAAARRLLLTTGLTVAGAALTFAFSSAAWADDTETSSGTGQTSTTAVAAESTAVTMSAQPAEAPVTTAKHQEEPETTESEATESTQAKTPKPKVKPAEVVSTLLATTSAAVEEDAPKLPVKPSGGLLGGLVNTVGGVLDAVTSTVGSVGDAVLRPVLAPILAPVDHCPAPQIVVPLPESDDGFDPWPPPATADARGTTSTIAVITPEAGSTGTTATAVEEPQPARITPVHQLTTVTATTKHHSAPAPAAPAPDDPESKVRAGSGGGGGAPGGGTPPSTPCAPPAGHSASAHPGQDNNGGRNHLGVLPSSDSTTQLRLIGTSRDHAADGAGREAALPTTSPD
ncbi:hypothetical protein [Amycolatopsis magusensis]|uniref:hypothetical protein n=1 Tax=Amycolatopsis magusensis TaxID=882444 RepID=UPI003790FED2